MMLRARRHSIATELTWMNMLVSAAALSLACAAFVAFGLIVFRERMVRTLSIQAQIAGSNSVSAVLFNDHHSAETTLAALKAGPHIINAEIYTPDGRPFAGYWRGQRRHCALLPPMPKGQTEAHWLRNRSLVVERQISFQGKPVETVLIQSDLGEVNRRFKQYAVVVFFVLAVSLAAGFLISSFCRRAIAVPILRLADTAKTVSREKDYSIRIAPSNRGDELGILVESFNEMLGQIQERDAALQGVQEELERRVEERTAQLQAANKELEAFSYSVSHDLRAPLRHISGFSKLLARERSIQSDATIQHYLSLIQDGARNMGELIDDLLNMGRIGRQELVCKRTDLNRLLQDILEDLQPELGGRQIDWHIGPLPTLECDPGLIKQVFINLLSNAVKYTRRRECAVIQVGETILEGDSVIFVRDNGAGFEQQYVHKLFGVFQRLHRAEEFEGTGVGLATVRRIIERHGGRVWAEGEADKGATFFLTLGPAGQGAGTTKTAIAEVSHEIH